MPRTRSKFSRGFTFIEIIIVIAIIALLATFFINTQGTGQKRARDTQRKSDLNQYRNSLEVYSSKNSSLYPSRTDVSGIRISTICASDLNATGCSEDPKYSSDNTFTYLYQTDGSGSGTANATKYVLWSKLEATSEYFVYCSNGKSGTKAQSGFSVSGGTCPL